MKTGTRGPRAAHLAGLVPTLGTYKLGFPWQDDLMPIGDRYTLLDRAVEECAWAGCETIWIVGSPETQPIVRRHVGEWVVDKGSDGKYGTEKRPIYYVACCDAPWNASQLGKIMFGAYVAYQASDSMSHWLWPAWYYVAFVDRVYNPSFNPTERAEICEFGSYIENGGGFTFNAEKWCEIRDNIERRGIKAVGWPFATPAKTAKKLQRSVCQINEWKDILNEIR